MKGEWIFIIILAIIFIALLTFKIIHVNKFMHATDNLEKGMSYSEVIAKLGEPDSINSSEDITTCIWSITGVLRYSRHTRVVVFKDGKAISATTD